MSTNKLLLAAEEAVEKAILKARSVHDNIKEATLPLSQVDSIVVKRLVTDADVVAEPTKYHSSQIGATKWLASFDTIEKARAADTTVAKTLTEYEYPDEKTILIIEKS